MNISVGVHEEKMMMTGMYTVADIFCVGCGSIVGWRYVRSGDIFKKIEHELCMF